MTLTEFLLARIAEEEGQAEGVHRMATVRAPDDIEAGEDAGRWADWMAVPTTRFLAECQAKRRVVVALSEVAALEPESLTASFALDAVRYTLAQLAVIYADHPDYRSEWRPR